MVSHPPLLPTPLNLSPHYRKDPRIRVSLQTLLITVFLLAILLTWMNNKERDELEKKLVFQDERLAHLSERLKKLKKSKTCLDVETLVKKSKEIFDYTTLKEKSKLLFDSLGEKSKDVYGDLDSLKAKSKRYLSELFASYWP